MWERVSCRGGTQQVCPSYLRLDIPSRSPRLIHAVCQSHHQETGMQYAELIWLQKTAGRQWRHSSVWWTLNHILAPDEIHSWDQLMVFSPLAFSSSEEQQQHMLHPVYAWQMYAELRVYGEVINFSFSRVRYYKPTALTLDYEGIWFILSRSGSVFSSGPAS